jgi:hypothetical protein
MTGVAKLQLHFPKEANEILELPVIRVSQLGD